MRSSSKDLSIFDFKSDDPKEAGDMLNKYKFLEAFTSGSFHLKQPDISNLQLVDLHEADSPERSTPDRNVASTDEKSELDDVKACSISYPKDTKICISDCRPVSPVMGTSAILAASTYDDEDCKLQSSEVHVKLMSDEEESCTSASQNSSTSGGFLESDDLSECPALELCHSACEKMDDNKNPVVVCPDYVNYRDTLFLESMLTFCSDCIKIECSDASRTDEKLSLVCDIKDIIQIACHWSRSVGTLLFKFWISTNSGHDVEKFTTSIADVCWLDKEKKIKSLAERYEDIWNSLSDSTYALEDDIHMTQISFSKRYFSEIMEPFEDVIYPKGDHDAVSISKRDIELLEPDTFINDTIIDFYIKYLQNKVQPNEKRSFHFFNSFFFRKLADLDKDPGSISQGREAFQRVRKWTRKLNIFEKDYIFIPVNFNLHWSLLVICHPGEIITFVDADLKSSPKVPCILHMDSIKGSHNGLKDLIQSYLLEEWKERHPELPEDITPRFSNLRFVSLELPQQENSSDCGLFLLHYVELFLKQAPVTFNPTRITKLSYFLSADWFQPAEASFKRFHIRGLLYELLRDSSQKRTPTCSNGDFPCSGDDVDQAVEFTSAEDSPLKIVNGSTSTPLRLNMFKPEDDDFVQSAALEFRPTTCLIEGLEDATTDTTELLVGEENEESSDHLIAVIKDQDGCQPPVGSPISQVCLTSCGVDDEGSCKLPCIFEQAKEVIVDTLSTRSNYQLPISNEKCETQKLTSAVSGGAFVPDSPDTSVENLKEYEKISQEMDDSLIDVERHDNFQLICGVAHDHCNNDEKYSETCEYNTKVVHEEESEKADSLETENGKAYNCLQDNQTADASLNAEEYSCMAENFDGGNKELSDSPENNVVEEISKQCMDSIKKDLVFHDSAMVEVISLDGDVIQSKRNKLFESGQQTSKRRKVVSQDILRRRVTRSTSKECT